MKKPLACLVAASAALLLLGSPIFGAELANIAPLGTATESTEYPGYPATNAIDGNYANFTHTNVPDATPTWQVDLGKEYAIEKVILYNRTNCCPERLRDITVSILAADGTTSNYVSALLNESNQLGGPLTIEIDLVLEAAPSALKRATEKTWHPPMYLLPPAGWVWIAGGSVALSTRTSTSPREITLASCSLVPPDGSFVRTTRTIWPVIGLPSSMTRSISIVGGPKSSLNGLRRADSYWIVVPSAARIETVMSRSRSGQQPSPRL